MSRNPGIGTPCPDPIRGQTPFPVEVHAAPEGLVADVVMDMALPSADRAAPPEPLADVDVHDERGLAFRVFPEIEAVDNRSIDMEEILQ